MWESKPLPCYELRVPTDMYAYISRYLYDEDPEKAVAAYKELVELVKPQPVNAMAPREFDELCEEYYEKGQLPGGADSVDKFSPAQNAVIKTITRIIRKRN